MPRALTEEIFPHTFKGGGAFCGHAMQLEDGVVRTCNGTVHGHIHGWVGRPSDSGSNDVPCRNAWCGELRLSGIHAGLTPRFTEGVKTVEAEAIGPPQDYETRPALVAWDEYSARVRQLLEAKQQGYGDAWLMQGYMGNLARVLSKAARLENTMWHDDESNGIGATVGGDSLADTLLDLGPLSAFMLANFESGNRWGRGR